MTMEATEAQVLAVYRLYDGERHKTCDFFDVEDIESWQVYDIIYRHKDELNRKL